MKQSIIKNNSWIHSFFKKAPHLFLWSPLVFFIFFIIYSSIQKMYAEKPPLNNKRKPLYIGTSLDLSKSLGFQGKRIKQHMDLIIQGINQEGGVNGHPVYLTALDNEYTPEKAKKNIETLLKDNINIILNPLGSPTLKSYLNLIKEEKVLVLFPIASASFQKHNLKYLIRFRAPTETIGYILAKYSIETLKATRIAVFYQDDSFGESGLTGILKYLNEKGISQVEKIPYPRNVTDLRSQVTQIKKFDPDTIIFISVSVPTKAFIRQLGTGFFSGKNLLGSEDLAEEPFQLFLKNKGLKLIIGNVVPNPNTSQLEIVEEFRKYTIQENISLDAFALEVYINMKLFVYLLKQIEGPITMETIVNVAEQVKDREFKGLKLNFDTKTRQLSNTVWLNTGKDQWNAITT